MKIALYLASLGVTLIAVVMLSSAVAAQTDDSLSISPAKHDILLGDGETQNVTTTIKNNGTRTVNIRPKFQPFLPLKEGVPEIGTASEQSIGDWVTFDASLFELKPGTTRNLSVAVTVPANQTTSARWGAIVFEAQDTKTDEVTFSIASLLLANVEGVALAPPRVEADIQASYGDGVYTYAVNVTNTGLHYLAMEGDIIITDSEGREVEILSLGTVGTPTTLLPGFPREFVRVWQPDVPPLQESDYTVSLYVTDGEGNPLVGEPPKTIIAPDEPEPEEDPVEPACGLAGQPPCLVAPPTPNYAPQFIAGTIGTLFVGGVLVRMFVRIRYHHEAEAVASHQDQLLHQPTDNDQR